MAHSEFVAVSTNGGIGCIYYGHTIYFASEDSAKAVFCKCVLRVDSVDCVSVFAHAPGLAEVFALHLHSAPIRAMGHCDDEYFTA